MRWADLGDHRQGIKWIKCFNPPQQERKKKKKNLDWLTESHLQSLSCGLPGDWLRWQARTQSSGQLVWRAQVSQRWILPSAADVLRHRITSFTCYIILLQYDTDPHTHTHTLTRLTHADTHARGEAGSTTDVPFANVSAPPVSQPPPAYVLFYSGHNVFAYDCAFCVRLCFLQTLQDWRRAWCTVCISAAACSSCVTHMHTR